MLLGHLNALSHEVPVPVFCPLTCRSLLFIKGTSSFSDVSIVNIFLPVCGFLFHCYLVDFNGQSY